MKRRIADSAEVSVDFPEKVYYGSFTRHSTFDVKVDEHGVHLELERSSGERRHVGVHIHYHLLADIFSDLGKSVASCRDLSELQRDALREAAAEMLKDLEKQPRRRKKR